MIKRSEKTIIEDIKKIKHAINNLHATTWKEVCEHTKLTRDQINTTIANTGSDREMLAEQLKQNKAMKSMMQKQEESKNKETISKAKNKEVTSAENESETLQGNESAKKSESETLQENETVKKSESETLQENETVKKSESETLQKNDDKANVYLIDASIINAEDFSSKIKFSGKKILTLDVFEEFRPLRKKDTLQSANVRQLFRIVAENKDKDWELLNYNFNSCNNNTELIEYCKKNNILLVTSNAETTIDARFKGVKVVFWQPIEFKSDENENCINKSTELQSLKYCKLKSTGLYIYPQENMKIWVNCKLIQGKTQIKLRDKIIIESRIKGGKNKILSYSVQRIDEKNNVKYLGVEYE
ncbi:MAG: hypothetical protein J6K42_05145 [Clostridia bacterium]|nr:hypothetical protein [Clostridia bacterium]